MTRRPAAWPAAVALFIFLITTTPFAAAQAEPVPIEDYWSLLRAIRASLDQADDLSPNALAALGDDLDAVRAVRLEDGAVLAIEPAFLVGLLKADPPDTLRAAAVLDAALSLHGRNYGLKGSGSEYDLGALAAVLAGAEYNWDTGENPNPFAELQQRFLNWLQRMLLRIAPGANLGQLFSATAITAISILILLILRYVYSNAVSSVVREAEMDPAAGVPIDLTAAQALNRAHELAENDDLRDAVRYLYLATLYRLEENGEIRLDRTHTNRELIADLAGRPDLAETLRAIIRVFDRVWYGFRPISQDEFSRYAELVGGLTGRG